MKKSTGISLATVATVVTILAGLYTMDAFNIFVFASDYEQDKMDQMTRSDSFELRNVKEDLLVLKGDRRDAEDILFNLPDDEKMQARLDTIEDDIDELEGRKCFLMDRNGMRCRERKDE